MGGFFGGGGSSGPRIYSLYIQGSGGTILRANTNAAAFTLVRNAQGQYTITHNLGFAALYNYASWGQVQGFNPRFLSVSQNTNSALVQIFDNLNALQDADFTWTFISLV